MSKNKNPLKDLDLFLKQQAASFVNPTPLSERVQAEETPKTAAPLTFSEDALLEQLDTLARNNKKALYDLIIKVAEKQNEADSTMLINTALYLKSGDNWKEAVREYWKNR
jgi:hypothetical protein